MKHDEFDQPDYGTGQKKIRYLRVRSCWLHYFDANFFRRSNAE